MGCAPGPLRECACEAAFAAAVFQARESLRNLLGIFWESLEIFWDLQIFVRVGRKDLVWRLPDNKPVCV